jgi:hypothetical protein
MANATYTKLARYHGYFGPEFGHLVLVVGGTDYTAGGYAITPATLFFNSFSTDNYGTGKPPVSGYYWIVGAGNANGAATGFAYVPAINPTNGNLQFFDPATGAEVTDATGAVAWLFALGH